MKLSYISESLNLTGSNLGMTNINAIHWSFFSICSTLVDDVLVKDDRFHSAMDVLTAEEYEVA